MAAASLEVVDHYDYGPVVLPNSPLRFHDSDTVPTRVSPRVGEHNDEIYRGWLGPVRRRTEPTAPGRSHLT